MKKFIFLSILLCFSVGINAQNNTQSEPKESKTTFSGEKQVKELFTFSQELENAKQTFEQGQNASYTGARTSNDPEMKKSQYLRKLNWGLHQFANDLEKTKIIQKEIDRINAIK